MRGAGLFPTLRWFGLDGLIVTVVQPSQSSHRKPFFSFALLGLTNGGQFICMRRSMITPNQTNSLDVALVVISVILCPSQLFSGYYMDGDVIGRAISSCIR